MCAAVSVVYRRLGLVNVLYLASSLTIEVTNYTLNIISSVINISLFSVLYAELVFTTETRTSQQTVLILVAPGGVRSHLHKVPLYTVLLLTLEPLETVLINITRQSRLSRVVRCLVLTVPIL